MPTDPEPRYCIIVENIEGSIAKGYPHGPDVFLCIDALEMERWMKRVVLPQPIGSASTLLDAFRERSICIPE